MPELSTALPRLIQKHQHQTDPVEKAKRLETETKLATLVGLVVLVALGVAAFASGLGLMAAGSAAPSLKILMVPGILLCLASSLAVFPAYGSVQLMIDLYKKHQAAI